MSGWRVTRRDIMNACRDAGYTVTFEHGVFYIFSPWFHKKGENVEYEETQSDMREAIYDIDQRTFGGNDNATK